jgi:hypothetical protein
LAARVETTPLSQRDQALDNTSEILRFRQRRFNLLVLNQRCGHITEHRGTM